MRDRDREKENDGETKRENEPNNQREREREIGEERHTQRLVSLTASSDVSLRSNRKEMYARGLLVCSTRRESPLTSISHPHTDTQTHITHLAVKRNKEESVVSSQLSADLLLVPAPRALLIQRLHVGFLQLKRPVLDVCAGGVDRRA
jgi:hypothetical protein